MNRLAVIVVLATCALPGAEGFRFRALDADSLELSENGKPVYVYNHGMVLRNGAPEDRRRSSYVHPVYTPDGVALTDDFPRDHWHHRGIFWAWPVVIVNGVKRDGWLVRGIGQRFERWIAREASAEATRLEVENGWYAEGAKVAAETVRITARPAAGGRREILFALRIEAARDPIEIAGEPAQNKGYGGFSVRFAPREETVIVTDRGREGRDTDMVPHAWARLEGTFAGRRAGLRIDIDPANPGFPNGWCLRHYGFLGVNYPGGSSLTLRRGEPLEMKYRVTVYSK